ncbi:MAG: hypothetical protein KVP17_003727 [Porospora cf. gigantea B]|uniref:uncharacterized protein n=1 Tax=Porospora cf. gigantea B TaxID=2853592 RepID=UPI003571BB94|nr:MAG: hypothetical protein KVP17_003727 [Porospora cf. gigantea B]
MLPFALAWVVDAQTGVSAAEGAGLSWIAVLAMIGVCFSVLSAAQEVVLPVVLSAVFVLSFVGIIARIPFPAILGASVHSIVQSRWASEPPTVLLWVVGVPFAGPAVEDMETYSWIVFPAAVTLLW